MKKCKKSLFVLMLSLTFCLSIFSNVFAVAITPMVLDGPAELTVYSVPDSNYGQHSFIVVKNYSSQTIQVGYRYLAPNESVSLGTWGNKSEHNGIWYNLESYYYGTYESYSGRVSLTQGMDSYQLNSLNTYIRNNDSWDIADPCSTFAAGCWNTVCADMPSMVDAGFISTPNNVANSIKSHSGYLTNRAFATATASTVYYTSGQNIILVSAASSSLTSSSSSQ